MVRYLTGLKVLKSQMKNLLEKKEVKVLSSITKNQVKIFNKLKNNSKAIKLDPINKKKLSYPKSLYPSKNCPLEWWYFTGHLKSDKERFGFEFCIFKFHPQEMRLGIIPLSLIRKEPFLITHSAITDKKNKKFISEHKNGLLYKNKIAYDKIKLEMNNSSLILDEKKFKFKIKSKNINLELKPEKEMIKHFNDGYDVLYSPPNHKTYYLSFTRLKTIGSIKLGSKTFEVTGSSWFDHQKMSMHRNSSLVGWDWFSIIFEDNTELMFILMKDKNGFNSKFHKGTYIDENSNLVNLKSNDVNLKVMSKWKSPKTDVIYPSSWIMEIPKLKLKLKIKPYVDNQEIESRFTTILSYWEGACKVNGTKNNKKIKGESYVELVGYDTRFITNLIQASTK